MVGEVSCCGGVVEGGLRLDGLLLELNRIPKSTAIMAKKMATSL
jgi:hypothetical protein